MSTKKRRVRNMQGLLEKKTNVIPFSLRSKKNQKNPFKPSRFNTMTEEEQRECMKSMYQDEDR